MYRQTFLLEMERIPDGVLSLYGRQQTPAYDVHSYLNMLGCLSGPVRCLLGEKQRDGIWIFNKGFQV